MTKSTEILELYLKFMDGEKLSKSDIQEYFNNKSDRTIQRYISQLNEFLVQNDTTSHLKIEYKYENKAYQMINYGDKNIDKTEILAILKILISSRGLIKEEIEKVVNSLTERMSEENRRMIHNVIRSELINYKPMVHESSLLNKIWHINQYIQNKNSISFEYANAFNKIRTHIIRPMYITFSELYFYLVGVNEKGEVIIYRVDRILDYHKSNQHIKLPSSPYYNEGELKKRIYFMYGGEWKRVVFEFNNGVIESVLDRFPTAKLIKKDYKENRFIVEVEVIGDGIIMWLLSQGSKVKILQPQFIKKLYLEEIKKMHQNNI